MRSAVPHLALAFIAAILPAAAARADDAPPPDDKGILPIPDYAAGDFWTRNRMTGDWGGARTDLANHGLQLDLNWTQTVQSVPQGGRGAGSAYGGHLDLLATYDLQRANLLPGAFVKFRAESIYGESANTFAGPILPVNTNAFFPIASEPGDNVPIAITDLTYYQFLAPQFGLFAGKYDTLDGDPNEFAGGRGLSQFMNSNFVFSPTLALNLPYATLGAGAIVTPSKYLTVVASVFSTADSSTTSGFDTLDEGTNLSVEADLQYHLGNLPGGFNLGGIWTFDDEFRTLGSRFVLESDEVLAPVTSSQTWSLYASGWQYLYNADRDADPAKPVDLTDGAPDHRGFGLFYRLGIADSTTNPVEWFASAGFGGRGPIPTRDNDTWGVGYFFTGLQPGRFSTLGVANYSQGAEAFYNVAITPYAHLTFDIQVVDDPFPNLDTSIILGARLNLSF